MDLFDLTAIMQFPLSVRDLSFVISSVVLCVALISSCPYAKITSVFFNHHRSEILDLNFCLEIFSNINYDLMKLYLKKFIENK
jgi:hypothetical protein